MFEDLKQDTKKKMIQFTNKRTFKNKSFKIGSPTKLSQLLKSTSPDKRDPINKQSIQQLTTALK